MKIRGDCDDCSRNRKRIEAGDFTLEEIATWSYSPWKSDINHTMHMLISYLIKERDSKPINIEFNVDV